MCLICLHEVYYEQSKERLAKRATRIMEIRCVPWLLVPGTSCTLCAVLCEVAKSIIIQLCVQVPRQWTPLRPSP